MYLIVGLGNPEPMYCQTRHNMGFDVINLVAKKYDIKVDKKKFDGLMGKGKIGENDVVLLKPQTYMNDSGRSIFLAQQFYNIPIENIIVIYDDIDLPVGEMKIRKKGGAGTHNGMRSVVAELNSTEFPHVRIGTGQPEFKEMLVSYVIQPMSDEQYAELKPAIEKAAEAVPEIVISGVDKAMNKFN